ncbi:unnamed protein product [Thelazia callipaeda]|uniref:GRIP domain-containing protein n=1 Tax=Thelazia callipaeda TaxID=103827 RepID=A0A0N5CU79_THECL|nr:unnamed protein product [Thelazia callipaeda]
MTSEQKMLENEYDSSYEIDNQSEYNNITEESLAEEAKEILSGHVQKRIDSVETILSSQKHQSTNSVFIPPTLARSVSTDTILVTASPTKDSLVLPHRRSYLNIGETKEENKRLKAEVYDLRLQLFSSKQNGIKRKDATQELEELQKDLLDEKLRNVECKEKWNSLEQKYIEERTKWEEEKNEIQKRCQQLLSTKEELETQLKEFYHQEKHLENDDGNESQVGSSLSTISITSDRDMEIQKLRSAVFQSNINEKKLRMKMETEITELQNKLKHAQDDLSAQGDYLRKEKIRCESLKDEILALRQSAEDAIQQVEDQQKKFRQELEQAQDAHNVALNKRDRTIRILLRKIKLNAAATPPSSEIENIDLDTPQSITQDLNPYVKQLLHQIDEFSTENDAIRKEVLQLGALGIDFTSESGRSKTSLMTEERLWDTDRCDHENEKLAALLAENRPIPDDSDKEEMEKKLVLFDAVRSFSDRDSEVLEGAMQSKNATELLNITSAGDLLNKSLTVTEDLIEIKKKLKIFQSASSRLFEKLRGTANFLQGLLDELGVPERGRALLAEIESFRIDLDQSLKTALSISRNVEAAEESMGDFSSHLQRSLNISSVLSDQIESVVVPSCSHEMYQNVVLASEKMRTNELTERNNKLQLQIDDLENVRQMLIEQINDMKVNMENKQDEILQAMKDLEAQLKNKSQEYEALHEEWQNLQLVMEERETIAAEKKTEMQCMIDKQSLKCRDLEIEVVELSKIIKMRDDYIEAISNLDNEICKVVTDAEEKLHISNEQADDMTMRMMNEEKSTLARLLHITNNVNQLSRIIPYVSDLEEQLVTLKKNFDKSKQSNDDINQKCKVLGHRNTILENDRLVKTMWDLEAKYDQLVVKQSDHLFLNKYPKNQTVGVGTMTSLSAQDLIELVEKKEIFTDFASRMFSLAATWNKDKNAEIESP